MTLLLKSLLGIGTITISSTVAVVSSKTLWNNSPSNESAERKYSSLKESHADSKEEVKLSESNARYDSGIVKSATPSPQKVEISSSKSEAEKLKERIDNPDLCRNVLSSAYGNSSLRACRENINGFNVEFEYYTSDLSMPLKIKNLKFDSRELVITLEKEDSYGQKVVRMDLTEEMIAGRGLFSSFAGGKNFTDKQCKLQENYLKGQDWKISC